jgi:hypothetical protein
MRGVMLMPGDMSDVISEPIGAASPGRVPGSLIQNPY